MYTNKKIDFYQKEIAEEEIRNQRKAIDYNTVSYPLEYFKDKISQQEIDSSLYWNKKQQSYFIESLLLGLPVLNIVINEIITHENEVKIEVIDGKQRLYTALKFINGNLMLENLSNLSTLNSFRFEDLVPSRQKDFKRITVRVIVVAPDCDQSIWKLY